MVLTTTGTGAKKAHPDRQGKDYATQFVAIVRGRLPN
jgi:hypothetical protein